MRKVLMVAFHYPPYEGGSGVHRTLKFSRYLPGCGWLPVILSAHPRAYPKVADNQLQEIPEEVIVKRAFALNTACHLAIGGSYLRLMALPDPWVTWWIGGVWAGLKLVRQYRPEIIWSTYPVATAHLIGLTLHCMTGIPWVADFRDPMTEENYRRTRGRDGAIGGLKSESPKTPRELSLLRNQPDRCIYGVTRHCASTVASS